MNKIWKKHEDQFIRDNAETMKDKELAEHLSKMSGRKITLDAVRKRRQGLGIKKAGGRGVHVVIHNN